ncbi:hypothetical protein JS756_36255, partial [Streptomyces actuosus]
EDTNDATPQPSEATPAPAPAPSKPVDSNKKKNKKKKKAAPKRTSTEPADAKTEKADLGDIDRALKDLAVDNKQLSHDRGDTSTTAIYPKDNSFPKTPEELLSIEPKSLNAINEMKKLFGNVVLENFDQEDNTTGRRRE